MGARGREGKGLIFTAGGFGGEVRYRGRLETGTRFEYGPNEAGCVCMCVCLHLELKYETPLGKKRMRIEFCPLTRSLVRGPPPPPSSLSLSLSPQHSLSLHPLSERHAEAVGSLCRVWGSVRAVRGCYLGLLQQTGSSSPKGRGREDRVKSHAQPSLASQESDLHSSREEGSARNSGIGRKGQQGKRESDNER